MLYSCTIYSVILSMSSDKADIYFCFCKFSFLFSILQIKQQKSNECIIIIHPLSNY